MSVVKPAVLAGLDAFPFAVLAAVASVVFGRADDLGATFVGAAAGTVGLATLLVLATISANYYRKHGCRFYFTRTVVVEGLLSLP